MIALEHVLIFAIDSNKSKKEYVIQSKYFNFNLDQD